MCYVAIVALLICGSLWRAVGELSYRWHTRPSASHNRWTKLPFRFQRIRMAWSPDNHDAVSHCRKQFNSLRSVTRSLVRLGEPEPLSAIDGILNRESAQNPQFLLRASRYRWMIEAFDESKTTKSGKCLCNTNVYTRTYYQISSGRNTFRHAFHNDSNDSLITKRHVNST